MVNKIVIVGVALALSAADVAARVDVREGNIINDTTWKRKDGIHYVHGDITIWNGATLTIEAGVEVRFYEVTGTGGYEDGAEIVVKSGALVAGGEGGMPVKFTSANKVRKMGDWGALVVVGSNQLILKNAVVEYATNGVRLHSTNAIGASRSSFEGTIIRHCLHNGVLAYNSYANLYHLSVENNGYAGIKTLYGCYITVNCSDIWGNGSYDFYNGSSKNVDATNCWWGTTTPTAIEKKIYDRKDDPTKGEVDYTPYLTAPWPEGGRVPNYSLGFVKSFFK
ncbi:MAG: hypothetical protein GTN49_01320 [candidate division Zixibacteria bacterium]|nr:hypothetical protein [candidate division Zixibacteria bacterium]